MACTQLRLCICTALTFLLMLSNLCRVQAMGCSAADEEFLKHRRLESLLVNLQAQLGSLADLPDSNETATTPPPTDQQAEEVRESYDVLMNASKSIGHNKACQAQDFYAKPVTSFLGTMIPADLAMDVVRRRRRTASTTPSPTHSSEQGILSGYTINLNFSLDDDLKDISRADLLLYQLPTLTGPTIEPRDYQQFVEIRTVLGERERHVIEGKYIDTFGSGYQVFEITSAVKLWVLRNIRGNVSLEVVIYCYSSPDCATKHKDGKEPAKIDFLFASNKTEREPRVIIVSTNPLEHKDHSKVKRSATDSGSKFCSDSEETCCLKPLTLNFHADLNMRTITHPATFEANYCQGICPALPGTGVMTPQRFSFLRDLGNNHPAASLEPCCAGAEYEDEQVVMNVYNRETRRFEVRIVKLQQVRVTKCRCA